MHIFVSISEYWGNVAILKKNKKYSKMAIAWKTKTVNGWLIV